MLGLSHDSGAFGLGHAAVQTNECTHKGPGAEVRREPPIGFLGLKVQDGGCRVPTSSRHVNLSEQRASTPADPVLRDFTYLQGKVITAFYTDRSLQISRFESVDEER